MDPINAMSLEAAKITQSAMPLSFEDSGINPAEKSGNFSALLAGFVNQIEETHAEKKEMIQNFLGGENIDIHKIMITGAKEDVMIKAASTISTKVASAYQTLMNIQV